MVSKFTKKGKYRINPATGKKWINGEIRKKDNRYFIKYKYLIDKDGYYLLAFVNYDAYLRDKIASILRRNKFHGYKSNLDLDYLVKIFPKNSMCPVLGYKMSWNNKTEYNSPSLDKINPKKGYVKNNVIFMCHRANRIKSDANSEEVLKVGNWLRERVKNSKTVVS